MRFVKTKMSYSHRPKIDETMSDKYNRSARRVLLSTQGFGTLSFAHLNQRDAYGEYPEMCKLNKRRTRREREQKESKDIHRTLISPLDLPPIIRNANIAHNSRERKHTDIYTYASHSSVLQGDCYSPKTVRRRTVLLR